MDDDERIIKIYKLRYALMKVRYCVPSLCWKRRPSHHRSQVMGVRLALHT
jgi:hypothetical protein